MLLCVVNFYLNILCCNVETSGGMFTVFYFILFAVFISFMYAFASVSCFLIQVIIIIEQFTVIHSAAGDYPF